MKRVVVALLVIGLAALVAYLAGNINHGRYRLTQEEDLLLVERGYKLPFGFGRYHAETPMLQSAYAPIPVPEGASVRSDEVYNERGDLDHAIFSLLAAWAHSRLAVGGEKNLELASVYLERALLLPALSEDQRAELQRFRGQVAYRSALTRIDDITTTLNRARTELQLAVQAGVADPVEVDRLLNGLAEVETAHQPLLAKGLAKSSLGSTNPADGTPASAVSPNAATPQAALPSSPKPTNPTDPQ